MERAKRVLSPWWRVDEASSSNTRSSHAGVGEAGIRRSSQEQQSTREVPRYHTPNPLAPISSFTADSPVLGSDEPERSSLTSSPTSFSDYAFFAQYFPSNTGTSLNSGDMNAPGYPANPGSSQIDAVARSMSMFPYPPGNSNRPYAAPSLRFPDGQASSAYCTRQTPSTSIAPIDLSTSIEHSLSSLRNSIVAVSAGLDGLARQQSIALTTENLRMNEEVGSLRAIVHGLRMQVSV